MFIFQFVKLIFPCQYFFPCKWQEKQFICTCGHQFDEYSNQAQIFSIGGTFFQVYRVLAFGYLAVFIERRNCVSISSFFLFFGSPSFPFSFCSSCQKTCFECLGCNCWGTLKQITRFPRSFHKSRFFSSFFNAKLSVLVSFDLNFFILMQLRCFTHWLTCRYLLWPGVIGWGERFVVVFFGLALFSLLCRLRKALFSKLVSKF